MCLQLIFEGTGGQSKFGDIAIDDVSLASGICPVNSKL